MSKRNKIWLPKAARVELAMPIIHLGENTDIRAEAIDINHPPLPEFPQQQFQELHSAFKNRLKDVNFAQPSNFQLASALPRPNPVNLIRTPENQQFQLRQLDLRINLFSKKVNHKDSNYQKINIALQEAVEFLGLPKDYFRFDMIEDSPNAFTIPRLQKILITDELIKLLGYDLHQVMGVLFHELGHFVLQCTNPQTNHIYEGRLDEAIYGHVHSFEEEYRCDQFALILANKLGYDLAAVRHGLEAIQRMTSIIYNKKRKVKEPGVIVGKKKKDDDFPFFTSTHPGTARRIQHLQRIEKQFIPNKDSKPPEKLGTSKYVASKELANYKKLFPEDEVLESKIHGGKILLTTAREKAFVQKTRFVRDSIFDKQELLDPTADFELVDLPPVAKIQRLSQKQTIGLLFTFSTYLADPEGQEDLQAYFQGLTSEQLEKLILSYRLTLDGCEVSFDEAKELVNNLTLSPVLTLLFLEYYNKAASTEIQKITKSWSLFENLASQNHSTPTLPLLHLLDQVERLAVQGGCSDEELSELFRRYSHLVAQSGVCEFIAFGYQEMFQEHFPVSFKLMAAQSRSLFGQEASFQKIDIGNIKVNNKGETAFHRDLMMLTIDQNATWLDLLSALESMGYKFAKRQTTLPQVFYPEKITGTLSHPLVQKFLDYDFRLLASEFNPVNEAMIKIAKFLQQNKDLDRVICLQKIQEMNETLKGKHHHGEYSNIVRSADNSRGDNLEFLDYARLAHVYTPRQIFEKLVLDRKRLAEQTSYTIGSSNTALHQNYDGYFDFAEIEDEIVAKPFSAIEKLTEFLNIYQLKNAFRDQRILRIIAWPFPQFINDIHRIIEKINDCEDVTLLSKLLFAFGNPILTQSISKRLDRLRVTQGFGKLLQNYDRMQLAEVKNICQKSGLNFDEYAHILLVYPFPSYERDELLKPLVEKSPTMEGAQKISALLRLAPITNVQPREEAAVVASETFLDTVNHIGTFDKQEILLYLLGQKSFFSSMFLEQRLEKDDAQNLKKLFLFGRTVDFNKLLNKLFQLSFKDMKSNMDLEINLDILESLSQALEEIRGHIKRDGDDVTFLPSPKIFEKIVELCKELSIYLEKGLDDTILEGVAVFLEYCHGVGGGLRDPRFRMLKDLNLPVILRTFFKVEEPDSVIVIAQTAGVSLDLLLDQGQAFTTQNEQIEMLQQILVGHNGALAGENKQAFTTMLAELFIEKGKFNEEITPRKKEAMVKMIKFSITECPKEKIAELFHAIWMATRNENASIPAVARKIIQIYGPLMIKAGQYLSSHSDLPEEWKIEFKKLTDENTQSDKIVFHENLESSYTEQPFADIGLKRGEGSLAAVYEAKLKGNQGHALAGEKVAVKALHPWIKQSLPSDREFLAKIVGFINANKQLYQTSLPNNLADISFAQVNEEISPQREYENNQLLAAVLEGQNQRAQDSNIEFAVPKVIHELNTDFIYVMEFVDGVRIDDLEGLAALGINPSEVQQAVALEIVREIIQDGIFHADPNLGNFKVKKTAQGKLKITMLDTGHVVKLDPQERVNLSNLLASFFQLDSHLVSQGLANFIENKTQDVEEKCQRWVEYAQSNGYKNSSEFLDGFFEFCNANKFVLTGTFVQIVKTLGIMSGLLSHIDSTKFIEMIQL